MDKSEELEDCKKRIRSILIAYQKGCSNSEFNRAYGALLGKRVPYRDFGFRSDVEFLYSIPDVVRITPMGPNEYHLQGIADEKSKHIQLMVAKQKPVKSKAPVSRYRTSYSNSKLSYNGSRLSYSNSYSYSKPPRLREFSSKPLMNAPEPTETLSKLPVKAPKEEPVAKSSPREEVISLIKHFKNGIALRNLQSKYEDTYNKIFSLSKYGFSSLEECIENISELEIVRIGNEAFVIHESESSRFSRKNSGEKVEGASTFSSSKNLQEISKPNSEMSSKSKSNHSLSNNNGSLSESVTSKLEKVAQIYPQGIWSSDFPQYFEEVTLTTLDLHSLGYRSLAEFIDDAPDIFIRKPVTGSKKDFIIYPVNKLQLSESCSNGTLPHIGSVMIDRIIMNIKQILEAYPEGIPLQEFVHVYSINCSDSLHVQDLGFDDLENFLSSIKERVPLRFEKLDGVKTIYLLKLTDSPTELPIASPQACQQEAIPYDAVFPDFQFKQLSLPENHDYSKYIPVYVSSVVHPGHLYIHLQDDETSEAFTKLAEMESFYNGTQSNLYVMKNAHIKAGAACVALWPTDQHWYRALILSIPSMECVRVHYIDYGTRSTIPKSLLRYLKKEYSKFPALALRSSLSFLQPANKTEHWDPAAKERLLEMCGDIPLMAKIEQLHPNGVYSIVLCDTNGDKDVYINDELHSEGLAAYYESEPCKSIAASPEPAVFDLIPQPVPSVEYHMLSSQQAFQARYCLQVFATVAPSFAQNQNFLKLVDEISKYCVNSNPMQQNSDLSFNPAFGVPSTIPPAMYSFTNSNMMNNAYVAPSVQGTNATYRNPSHIYDEIISPPIGGQSFLLPPVSSPADIISAPASTSITSPEDKNIENDIFEDDDDEIFYEFCQKHSATTARFVKRVPLGDGYKLHIIVYKSKPYASSGDISQLIWNNKEAEYLSRRLQMKYEDIYNFILYEDGNEELFQQLERFDVKGVQKTSGFKNSILLYPLKVVIKILNIFGHPSISLRTKLREEINHFDPDAQEWKEFSAPEALETEEDEKLIGVTDDDKIERLCLYDLMAMKEGIKCRRLKMMSKLSHSDNSAFVDELTKLEQMHRKVLTRIDEIKEICDLFS